MEKCSKILLAASLLVCSNAFAGKTKKDANAPRGTQHNKAVEAHAQIWDRTSSQSKATSSNTTEADQSALASSTQGTIDAIVKQKIAERAAKKAAAIKATAAQRDQVLKSLSTSAPTLNHVDTVQSNARTLLAHDVAMKKVEDISITQGSLKQVPTPKEPDAHALWTHDLAMQQIRARATGNTQDDIAASAAPSESQALMIVPQPAAPDILIDISFAQDATTEVAPAIVEGPQVEPTVPVAPADDQTAAMAEFAAPAPAVQVAQEAATVATCAPAPVAEAPQAAPANTKPSSISTWMKTMCVASTNLAKALYYLRNTANRDDLTRKEIASRLGDAIPETIAALKEISSRCYGHSEIQSADEVTRLRTPLIAALEAALTMAITPEGNEKQIEVDTTMLKFAAHELKKLTTHEKHQATRVVQAASVRAHDYKKLAFLINANMESRGNNSLEGELSDDEYNGTQDMLSVVARETLPSDDAETK
jgi:hypothetical protein